MTRSVSWPIPYNTNERPFAQPHTHTHTPYGASTVHFCLTQLQWVLFYLPVSNASLAEWVRTAKQRRCVYAREKKTCHLHYYECVRCFLSLLTKSTINSPLVFTKHRLCAYSHLRRTCATVSPTLDKPTCQRIRPDCSIAFSFHLALIAQFHFKSSPRFMSVHT